MAEGPGEATTVCACEGTWKRESGSVMLGIARSKSGKSGQLLIVPEGLSNSGTIGVEVNESSGVYGALQAIKDCSTGQIHVTVQTGIDHTDSSCKPQAVQLLMMV